jgi:hypothetical protein
MGEHMREEKRRQWAEHIRNCSKSGKNQAQYCHEHGLSLQTFYYWKRKQKPEAEVRLVPVGMHQIQVHQAGSMAAPLALIIGRYKVEVGTGFDAATLARLVHTLDRI